MLQGSRFAKSLSYKFRINIYLLIAIVLLLIISSSSCSKYEKEMKISEGESKSVSKGNKILINTIKDESYIDYKGKRISISGTDLKKISYRIREIGDKSIGVDSFAISIFVRDTTAFRNSKKSYTVARNSLAGVEESETSGIRQPVSFEYSVVGVFNSNTLEWLWIRPETAYVRAIPPSQTYTDVYGRTIVESVQIMDVTAVPTSPLPAMAVEVTWTYEINYWYSIDGAAPIPAYSSPQTRVYSTIR